MYIFYTFKKNDPHQVCVRDPGHFQPGIQGISNPGSLASFLVPGLFSYLVQVSSRIWSDLTSEWSTVTWTVTWTVTGVGDPETR